MSDREVLYRKVLGGHCSLNTLEYRQGAVPLRSLAEELAVPQTLLHLRGPAADGAGWAAARLTVVELGSFGLTLVELESFWTYICRISFILDLHSSHFTHFELTFVELH